MISTRDCHIICSLFGVLLLLCPQTLMSVQRALTNVPKSAPTLPAPTSVHATWGTPSKIPHSAKVTHSHTHTLYCSYIDPTPSRCPLLHSDVDECVSNTHRCSTLSGAFCLNMIGSYNCSCPSGYHIDASGFTCVGKWKGG